MNATADGSAHVGGKAQGVLPALSRVLICLIFIQGALGKLLGWSGQAAYMAQHGIKPVAPLLAAATVIEVVGVLSLLVGYQARLIAFVMAMYLVVVSVLLHDFWSPSASMLAQTEFLKNMAIVGGLLMITAYGPGTLSLEAFLRRKKSTHHGSQQFGAVQPVQAKTRS